jgi:hypothetical protein
MTAQRGLASKLRIPAACDAMSVRHLSTPLPFATL